MKSVFALLLIVFVTACFHPLEIVGEGDIISASGNRTCLLSNFAAGDEVCSKNYAVGDYQETYYAAAHDGWRFDHWANYCEEAAPPNFECSFNFSATTVKKYWGQTMPPLQAVFAPISPVDRDGDGLADDVDPCPLNPNNPCALITDTITPVPGGREWAQPSLFTGDDFWIVNDCPEGVCNGIMGGIDLTGWRWATNADVDELAAYYAMFNTEQECPAVYSLFADGWEKTYSPHFHSGSTADLVGWTSDRRKSYAGFNTGDLDASYPCSYFTHPGEYPYCQFCGGWEPAGYWLYRDPS